MRRFALASLLLLNGCFGGGMEAAATHTGQNPRSDGVLATTARDTGCAVGGLRIVVETQRRYVNESAYRFVIEGCGERFGYVETCGLGDAPADAVAVNDSLWCRYLLVTRVPLQSASTPKPAPPVSDGPVAPL